MIEQSDARIRQLMGEIHEAAPAPHGWERVATWDANDAGGRGRRMLGAAAAIVVLVGGLIATAAVLRRDEGSSTPIEPPSPDVGASVELAPGFDVATVGAPVTVAGVTVYQGGQALEVPDELVASLGDAPEVALDPIAAVDFPIEDDGVRELPGTIVTLGQHDGIAIAVYHDDQVDGLGRAGRCVALGLIDDAAGWMSACSPIGPIGVGGMAGGWLAWPNLPTGTVLVAVVSADGEAGTYQRPTASSVAFPGTFDDVELVAFDASGAELERWPFRSGG